LSGVRTRTPCQLVHAVERPVEATKRELIAVSRRLERAALTDPPRAVAATLQDARYLTDRTRDVYAALARAGAEARLFARDLQTWLAPGVTGVALDDDDPLADEWVVVLPGPDPVVFAATDLHRPNRDEDVDRCFSYAVSRDPQLVLACAGDLGIGEAARA